MLIWSVHAVITMLTGDINVLACDCDGFGEYHAMQIKQKSIKQIDSPVECIRIVNRPSSNALQQQMLLSDIPHYQLYLARQCNSTRLTGHLQVTART